MVMGEKGAGAVKCYRNAEITMEMLKRPTSWAKQVYLRKERINFFNIFLSPVVTS